MKTYTVTYGTNGSEYDEITTSTGNKTIYVRSVCDTTNYSQYSQTAFSTTTVYNVTLTHDTGISDVSGNGNYITGSTVTLNASVKSGYTWSKWTNNNTQISTTKNYSNTITSN